MASTDRPARGGSGANRGFRPTRPGTRLDAAKAVPPAGAGVSSLAILPSVASLPTLPTLRTAARQCRACPLWRRATQTVFGEGPRRASLVFIGEQPGDQEDLKGHPFVGPSGRLLDTALAEVGLDRRQIYVTNAVKHFKWMASEGRGKRRLHEKPNAAEIAACRPWILAELKAVAPRAIVCLGATAAQSLLGRGFRVTKQRGTPIPSEWGQVVATVHPSSILRIPDAASRAQEMRRFSADLRVAAELVAR